MNCLRFAAATAFVAFLLFVPACADDANDGWVTIFDGTSMDGWKASENKDSWKLEDGAFVCHGPRSHLFYVGDDKPFKNFELKADVMTTPGSNAGIYVHTQYQEEGWPKFGHEIQVNISHGDPIKTGSIYGVVSVEPPAKDNEYWTQHIIVQGQHITVKINDKIVVDYNERKGEPPFSDVFERRLNAGGTFALQAHDPKSVVSFKNIRVKRLPDEEKK